MELWDIYDQNGERTGRTLPRGSTLMPGEYHLAVTVVLINRQNEVLCTHRAPEKPLCPNMWESPGGGAQAGEDGLSAAIREMEEETGLCIAPGQLVQLYRDVREDLIMDVFAGHMDFPAEGLRLQPGETDAARWMPLEEWVQAAGRGEILTPAKGAFFSVLRDFAKAVRWPQEEGSPELREGIKALQGLAWPEFAAAPWPEPGHVSSFCRVEGGALKAQASIMEAGFCHKGQPYRAQGIAEVVTHPSCRGQGYALSLLRAARAAIGFSGADVCIFTCEPGLRGLYEKAGFTPCPGLQLVGGTEDEPFPSGELGLVTFCELLSRRARAHEGDFRAGDVFLPLGKGRLW